MSTGGTGARGRAGASQRGPLLEQPRTRAAAAGRGVGNLAIVDEHAAFAYVREVPDLADPRDAELLRDHVMAMDFEVYLGSVVVAVGEWAHGMRMERSSSAWARRRTRGQVRAGDSSRCS